MAGELTPAPQQVQLPPGVKVGPPRETQQLNEQGQVTTGALFPVTLSNGAVTTIFVPYAQIENTAYIESLITKRVQALTAITG